MKRLPILVSMVLAGLLIASLLPPSYDPPPPLQREDLDLPELASPSYIDAIVKNDLVTIVLDLPERGQSLYAVRDILAIYDWGRTHFRPIKCGAEYPPEMCQVGRVEVYLRISQDPTTVLYLWLDQQQIDKLQRREAVFQTLAELLSYHQQVAEETQGTGGGGTLIEVPPVLAQLSR